MSDIKERLFGAITVMPEADAKRLWDIVTRLYGTGWAAVEEVEPDDIDLQMIQDAKTSPDCTTFASEEDIRSLWG